MDEAELSRIKSYLISKEYISKIALELGIDREIKISKSLEGEGRKNKRILEGAFEAIVAALFLSYGIDFTTKFIVKKLDEFNDYEATIDYKNLLQTILLKKLKKMPDYRVVSISGPKHKPVYEVELYIDGLSYGKAKSSSKKDASKLAAKNAYEKLIKEIK